MILNLNDFTLSYTVNGEDWGIACDELEETEYRACVSINHKPDSIEFLAYEQFI